MKKLIPAVVTMTLISTASLAGVKDVDGVEVRDWEAIDRDDDHHVSAEEMETFLRDIRARLQRGGES